MAWMRVSGSFAAMSVATSRWMGVRRDKAVLVALGLLVLLAAAFPALIPRYGEFVDWHTIGCLAGLLVVIRGIHESGFPSAAATRMVRRVKSERALALLMVLLSAGLATVLTNDIALFVVVPFTVALQSAVKNDVGKLVIFEAIAVNVGSALTPIGNPQNLFLWRQWGNRFHEFTAEMLPLEIVLLALLTGFTALCFRGTKLEVHDGGGSVRRDRGLFIFALVGLAGFILSIELDRAGLGLVFALGMFGLFHRRVVLRADWLLIALFILIFIDVRVVTAQPWVEQWFQGAGLEDPMRLYLVGIGLSQVVSNMPAAVLLGEFSQNWKGIAYAVNIGANGLVIGSLANIIALRLAGRKRAWLAYHLYSIPFLVVSATAGYLLLGG